MLARFCTTARHLVIQRSLFSTAASKPNCAVVLSGCGVYDGSEIQESSAVLFSLAKRANVQCFAPNKKQLHVINHTNGEEMAEERNVLVESARICRGNIKDLKELNADQFDCVLFPGGFGAAKNLCSFAVDGVNMKVDAEVERVVKEFRAKGKPMGFSCIAPVIPAKLIKDVQVTVGNDQDNEQNEWPYAGTAGAIDQMGGKHMVRGATQTHIDETNKVVTSAAYMFNGDPDDIYQSINAMCDGVLKLVK
eukprot:CAMPEP_0197026268 /NCGR_PEP_ID=MMETSP1384-20130603/6398_1 /TAXON_ID=29189 /ORGANISM="Ammonia sp." /LENGTH=249 /DNA_ID=CAMNT_0042454909 /DNA_START=35 /DNA_END=784 /DNA_ORIENTATION=-